MTDFLLMHEPWIRGGVFFAVFLTMAGLETAFPRRPRRQTRAARWPVNAAMVVLGSVAIRLMGPLVAVEAALAAARWEMGLFYITPLPLALSIALSILLLDLGIYAQHVVFHKVPFLWRIHRMHHADLDLDATSGIRFHPVEFVLSMLIKVAMVLLLGAPVAAVIMFEVILNAMATFNHANLALPSWLDKRLRLILVTPDVHIVHHSVEQAETDSNYGFNLSLWDRLFGTYRAQAAAGPVHLTIGVEDRQSPERIGLGALLWMPFTTDRTKKQKTA